MYRVPIQRTFRSNHFREVTISTYTNYIVLNMLEIFDHDRLGSIELSESFRNFRKLNRPWKRETKVECREFGPAFELFC